MNKDEISKEIGDFLKFNADDIRDLMKLSPDLANAFSNVVLALDEQYGAGLIAGKNIQNAISKGKYITKFLPGDYLNDVNKIDIEFKKLFKDGTIDDEVLKVGPLFTKFSNNLIVTGIYLIEGVLYYACRYVSNIDYFNDIILNISKVDVYLFEVESLDEYYDRYVEQYGETKYEIGSYILFKQSTQNTMSFDGCPMILDYDLSKKYTINNSFNPKDFYENQQVLFVKDIINYDNHNYYIMEIINNETIRNGTKMVITVYAFDSCYSNICPSIKNNDVFLKTYSTPIYEWIKAVQEQDLNQFSTTSLMQKSSSYYVKDYEQLANAVSTQEYLVRHYFEPNDGYFGSSNVKKLSKKERRDVIAKIEEIDPIIIEIKGGSTNEINDIFVPVQREFYVDVANFNLANKTRKSPTASASLYDEGTIMIGCDGGTWVIATDKNGTKRWKSLYNVFNDLPDELFVNINRSTTSFLNLNLMREIEEGLWQSQKVFDEKDEELTGLKQSLFAVREYIRYYPNVVK